jgi:probable F420-dependent oxidoreductase
MKFGIMFANVMGFVEPEGAVAIGQAAEAAGFESLWTVEHVVVPAGYKSTYPYAEDGRMPGGEDAPIPDPLIWLAFVAAATSTIKLATGILILPQRNPVIAAKEIATLDHLSRGRVILGVGAGWLEEEFDVIGVPFADRGARLDDHIEAMRALWTEETASVHGTHTSFDGAIMRPRPTQASVPIHIGGHSLVAARRAGRLGDGFFPAKGDLPKLFAAMREAAVDAGRDPDAIELTTGDPDVLGPNAGDAIKRLEDQGVSRVIIPPLAFGADGIKDALAQFGENVIAKFGD